MYGQVLLTEHVFEVLQHLPDHGGQVCPDHRQFVAVHGRLVELQELVREPDHALRIAFHHAHQLPVLLVQGGGAGEFLHRSVNKGQRGTELMGHVGEEGGTLLAHLLHQHLFLHVEVQPLAVHLGADIQVDTGQDGAHQQEPVQKEHRPGEEGGRADPHLLHQLFGTPLSVRTLHPHPEGVRTWRQAGVTHPSAVSGGIPIGIEAFQFILVHGAEIGVEVHGRKIEGHLGLPVVQHQFFRNGRKQGGAVYRNTVQLQGNVPLHLRIHGQEGENPVNAAEIDGPVPAHQGAVGGHYPGQPRQGFIGDGAAVLAGNHGHTRTGCHPDVTVRVSGKGTDGMVCLLVAIRGRRELLSDRVVMEETVPAGAYPISPVHIFVEGHRCLHINVQAAQDQVVPGNPDTVIGQEIREAAAGLPAVPERRMGAGGQGGHPVFPVHRKDLVPLQQVHPSVGIVPDGDAGLHRIAESDGQPVSLPLVAAELPETIDQPQPAALVYQGDGELVVSIDSLGLHPVNLPAGPLVGIYSFIGKDEQVLRILLIKVIQGLGRVFLRNQDALPVGWQIMPLQPLAVTAEPDIVLREEEKATPALVQVFLQDNAARLFCSDGIDSLSLNPQHHHLRIRPALEEKDALRADIQDRIDAMVVALQLVKSQVWEVSA